MYTVLRGDGGRALFAKPSPRWLRIVALHLSAFDFASPWPFRKGLGSVVCPEALPLPVPNVFSLSTWFRQENEQKEREAPATELCSHQTLRACLYPWVLGAITHESPGERRRWGYKLPKEEGVIFLPFWVRAWGRSSAPSRLLLVAPLWGRGERRRASEVCLPRQWFRAGGEGIKKWLVRLWMNGGWPCCFVTRRKSLPSKVVSGCVTSPMLKKEEEQRLIPEPWLVLGHMKSVCLS